MGCFESKFLHVVKILVHKAFVEVVAGHFLFWVVALVGSGGLNVFSGSCGLQDVIIGNVSGLLGLGFRIWGIEL